VLLHRSGALASFLSTGSHKADLIRFIDSFYQSSTHSFAETPKMTGDIVSTYYGIHSLSLIGGGGKVDVNANAKQIAEFVNGLQDRNGGFKLRAGSSQSGHYVNTYYALKILQELNKASVLETAFDEPEVIVREVVFIPINTIYLLVAVFLLGFGLVLYLLTREKEKEEKEDDEGEEGEAAEGKGKGKNKGKARKEESKTSEDSEEEKKTEKDKTKKKEKKIKIKKEPIITLYRDKQTGKVVDEDGEPFLTNLNTDEWTILERKETEGATVFKIRKREQSAKRKDRTRKRRNRNK